MENESDARHKPTKALSINSCGSVAQSVEQWPFKPLVPGSSPGRPTTFPTERLYPAVDMREFANLRFGITGCDES